MIYVRTTPPVTLPVTLSDVKAHLRREAGDTAEDTLLSAYLAAAVEHLDGPSGELHACLLTQGWTAYTDAPVAIGRVGPYGPAGFRIDLGPVQTDLTIGVEYRSGSAWLAVSPSIFTVRPDTLGGALIVTVPGTSWPVADRIPNAWRLSFTAGYGDDPEDVPAPIRAAILLTVADLDGNRDGKIGANLVTNPTVARLLAPYRRISI